MGSPGDEPKLSIQELFASTFSDQLADVSIGARNFDCCDALPAARKFNVGSPGFGYRPYVASAEQAAKVFTACSPLCSLPRKRKRASGKKPTFTRGLEANLPANTVDNPFSTPR